MLAVAGGEPLFRHLLVSIVLTRARVNRSGAFGGAMGLSSNAHSNSSFDIVAREGFSWDEDETVTQRRRRRKKASRFLVGTGVAGAIAFAVVLYEARIIAFGPLATAGPISSTSSR